MEATFILKVQNRNRILLLSAFWFLLHFPCTHRQLLINHSKTQVSLEHRKTINGLCNLTCPSIVLHAYFYMPVISFLG